MLSLPDAAEKFGIPHTTLWRRVKAGDVPHVRIGNTYGVRLADIERLAESLKRRRSPPRERRSA